MMIYLMQHGKPVTKEEDPDRPLSGEGRLDVERVAGFLKGCGICPVCAFHSGKTRARETAEIMMSALNPGGEIEEKTGLSPNDEVRDIAAEIKGRAGDLLITGHLPHLAKLTSFLIGGGESLQVVRFRQGGVVCLERDPEGCWGIEWMVVPAIIR